MAKTIQLTLKTSYANAGVKAMAADLKALQAALQSIGSSRAANPFDSFVKGARVAETEISRVAKAQRDAMKPPASTGVTKPLDDTAKSAQKAERSLLQMASAQARLQSTQGNAAGAIQTLSNALAQVDRNTVPAVRAMTQLQAAQNAVDKSSRAAAGGFQVLPRTIDGLSGPALNAAKALGTIGIALAGLRSAAQAISIVADTEQQLNVLQATVGATDAQMQQAAATAQALGADLTLPATSAAGAASAMIELTRQGLSLNDAMAAAKGTLQLAAAGAISEGEAALYTASALNQFKLSGDQAVHVADLLAASIAASGSGIQQTGQAVQQAGASFAAAGIPLADFVTEINEMSKAGIKGSDAGTSLKTMLMRLQAPTTAAADTMQQLGIHIYDANGQMLSQRDIIGQFSNSLKGLTEQQRAQAIVTIFGADAQRAANIVLNGGVAAFDAMREAVTKQGAAGTQAQAQMKGLNGAIASLQSQVETLASAALTPLLPLMTAVVQQAAELAGQLQGPASTGALALAGAIQSLATFIGSNAIPALQALVATGVLYALTNIPAIVAAVQTEIASLGASAAAYLAKNAAMLGTLGTYAAVAVALYGVAKAYQAFDEQVSKGADDLLNSRQWWRESADAIKQYNDMLQATGTQQDAVDPKMRSAANTVQILKDQIKQETDALAQRQAMYDAFKNTTGLTSPGDEKELADRLAHINQLSKGLQDATGYLKGLTGAQVEAAAAGVNASAVYTATRGSLADLGDQASLTADEIDEIAKAITKTTDEGIKTLGQYVSTNIDFNGKIESLTADHAAKLAALEKEAGAAKTDAARQAVADKIAAENAGYDQELQAQAAAYAQQEAAQRAHLGQMLIDYTVEQAQLGNIQKDRAAALVEGIKTQYGVVGDTISAAFLEATGVIDGFGANTAESVGEATSALGRVTDASVALNQRIAALQQQRNIEITAQFKKDNNLEAYKAALEAMPSEVTTAVQLDNAAANASASDYVRSVHAIPTAVNTVVNANTGTAVAEINNVTNRLAGVPKDTTGRIDIDAAVALANIQYVTAGLNSIPRSVTSTVTVNRVEQVTSAGIKRAAGGWVSGPGTGTSDSVPAMLSKGEYVVKASQAQKYGPLLHAINSGAQGYADGGSTLGPGVPVQDSRGSLGFNSSGAGYTGNGVPTVGLLVGANPALTVKQQKAINAQLLGDLQSYLNDALEAAKEYEKKRLDIEQKFQDDLKAQIVENDASKYENRADFYDKLTSATADIGKQQADAIAAQYEAMYAKAREAEQNGQADLAQKYDDFNNKRLGAEIDYQSKVADLKKKGVTKEEALELQRMAVIKQMRDQQYDAELGKINAQGDSIANARADALSQADQAYQEKQAEIEQKAADAFDKHADKATGASATVVSAVDAETQAVARLRDALNNLPIEKTVTVNVAQSGGSGTGTLIDSLGGAGSSTGGTTATGGQGFSGSTTRGVSKLKTGAGGTSSGGALQVIQDAQAILDYLAQNANRKRIFQLKDYRLQLDEAAQILNDTAAVSRLLSRPMAPLDPNAVRGLANNLRTIITVFASTIIRDVKTFNYLVGQYKEAGEGAISVLKDVAQFRKDFNVKDLAPLNLDMIKELAGQANQITRAITGVLLPSYSWQNNQLTAYHEALSAEVDILNGVADLRRGLKDPLPPFDVDQITTLAQQTRQIGEAIGAVLVPIAQESSDELTAYHDAVQNSTEILSSVAGLARDLKDPTPLIDLDVARKLAQESLQVGGIIGGVMVPIAEKDQTTLDQYAAAVRGSVDVLKSIADLRKTLTDKDAQGPLDIALVQRLATDAAQALYYVQGNLLVYTQQAQTELTQYAAMAKDAIDTLRAVADLRKSVADSGGALDPALLNRMAQDAQQATYYVLGAMVQATQETADGLDRYAQMASNAVNTLKNVADLRKTLSDADVQAPLNAAQVTQLAAEASQVTQIVMGLLLATTQEQADALSRYQNAVASSVGIVKSISDLRKDMPAVKGPIDAASITQLAQDAQRVTTILQGAVVPTAQEQVDALSRWQNAVSSSVSIAKDTLELSGKLFTDYQSPTDAQIGMIARDADRVVRGIAAAAATYGSAGLEAAKAYADAVGGTFTAFKDGLLFFDALRSGDFTLDPKNLASFESATSATIQTMARLGAQASRIPAADIAAMGAVTTALQNQASALVTLAAVPFADLPAAAAQFGQTTPTGGRSSTTNTFYNTFVLPDGSDAATADYVIQQLNTQMGARQ